MKYMSIISRSESIAPVAAVNYLGLYFLHDVKHFRGNYISAIRGKRLQLRLRLLIKDELSPARVNGATPNDLPLRCWGSLSWVSGIM